MSQLEEYNTKRRALISKERAVRFDSKAIANATPQELRAAEIVNKLRAREAQEIWSSSTEKLMYPGMEFLVAKETIGKLILPCLVTNTENSWDVTVKTELYQIIKKVRNML